MIDLAAGRLRVDGRPVELRPKTWDVLCALAERPGDLVTKNELLDLVWADTAVSEGTLNKSIGELRVALDDGRGDASCIETVPRRGYRWIGAATIVPRGGARRPAPAEPPAPEPFGVAADDAGGDVERAPIVARDDEIARLDALFARARAGRRQVAFVTGEAGAGKTTIVEHFLDRLVRVTDGGAALVLHGQCLETTGPHEPYLPLLDGLERLCRDPRWGDRVTPVLRRCAPSWIAQMPTLAAPPEAAAPAPGSMLRELVTAVDELAREHALVLVLEDAHWADLATTDACGALGKRRDPARLLLLVTQRGAEALALQHPIVAVRRDLVSRGAAEEIALVPFVGDELGAYLAARCPGLERHGEILGWLLQQTAGNPLFVRLVLDEWIARGMVEPSPGGWSLRGAPEEMRGTVPDSLRALLERQVARLEAHERAVLEAASVRFGPFHPASIAAAATMEPDEVDAVCERVAQRGQLLRACGEAIAADGRLAEQYAFLHATVQAVVAAGLPSARRRRLHLAAADQLEREHSARPQSVSSLLALHYEAGGDPSRAVRHLRESARQAMHRDSPRDAIVILERAIELIDAAPGMPDAENVRLHVLVYLTHARQLAFGFIDKQVAELWLRTSELAAANQDDRERLIAEAGRIIVSCVSARYAEAEELIRSTLPLVGRVEDPDARKTFLFTAATTRYRMGAMADSCAMFEAGLRIRHVGDPIPGAEMDALLMSQYAPAVALAGRPDEVRRLTHESMRLAREHSKYSECVTGTLVSWALAIVGDYAEAVPIAERSLEIAVAEGFRTWTTRPLYVIGMSEILGGRVDDGIVKVREGLEGRRGDGQWVDHSAMCCLFADALMNAGRDGADELVDEAAEFLTTRGELFAESEILRLRAKRRVVEGGAAAEAEAESLLRRSLDLADLRGIRWHALLAATDLARLLDGQGRREEAVLLLRPAFAAVSGGAHLEAVLGAEELLRDLAPVSAAV